MSTKYWGYRGWSLYKTLCAHKTFTPLKLSGVQLALVICRLFICDFAYMRLRSDYFSKTYPLLYSHPWSFLYTNSLYASIFFWSLSLAYNDWNLYLNDIIYVPKYVSVNKVQFLVGPTWFRSKLKFWWDSD